MKKLLIIIGVTIGLNTSIVAGPIHDAARNGDIEYIVKYIDDGGDVNLKNESGLTPLSIAVDQEKMFTAKYLITHGADVNASFKSDENDPVWAVLKFDHEILALMIENGLDANAVSQYGQTPILGLENIESVQLLIENGADVNVVGRYGQTPLLNAPNVEVARLLIENGADVNYGARLTFHGAPDKWQSPLSSARSDAVARLLLSHGATFNTKENKEGRSDTFKVVLDYVISQLTELKEKVDRLSTGTTNPTDEWPRKMWEIDLGIDFGSDDGHDETDIEYLRQAKDGAVLFGVQTSIGDDMSCYWISNTGEPKLISDDAFNDDHAVNAGWKTIIYLDSQHFIYMDDNSDDPERELSTITKLTRHQNGINKSVFSADKFGYRYSSMHGMDHSYDHDGISKFQTIQLATEGTKITGWDFTPPSEDTGNEGGGGRLIIKTAGPDISLATDGKLGGAAELQKSNDLRSWRKLGDVPEEASEVLVTPRESGNEFYRLKKK